MKNMVYQSPICEMKEMNNLFIEMTAKNCNMKCKHCYINFPLSKNIKDYIPIEKVKDAIFNTTKENIQCIYLSGAEPMMHPDFNSILRLCLKRSNVCIHTNGSFINEKKARFLKRVEDESNFEIIFKLNIDHYNEVKNDDIRSRGAYRQSVHAIKHLLKYDFKPIICVTNYYNLSENEILENFNAIFADSNYPIDKKNIQINTWHNPQKEEEITNWDWNNLDCQYGRVLTINGVYTCPFLANDHRGRSGADFNDFSRKNALETPFCTTCIKNKNCMFGLNYNAYK